jgi:hypothetical protein
VADFELLINMMPGKKAATINRSFVGVFMAANVWLRGRLYPVPSERSERPELIVMPSVSG